MATASAIRAGQAYIELLLNDNALLRGLKSAGNTLKSWGAGIAKIGAATMAAGGGILGGLGLSVMKFTETGVELQRVSDQTGIAVDELAALKSMAARSGVEFDALAGDLTKFQKNLASGKISDKLTQIGLSAAQLNGKSFTEQMVTIADAIAKTKDPAVQAAAVLEMFGKGARGLIPIFKRGGDAMREYIERKKKLFSPEDAARAEEFHEKLFDIEEAAQNAVVQIGGALVEALGKYLDPLVEGATAIGDWIREHRELAVTVAAAATAIVGIGVAITALGFVIIGAGTTLTTFVSILGGIGSVLAFLISPAGLVTVAIASLVGGMIYLATISEKTKPLLAEIGEGLTALKGRVIETFQGIADAIKAGDWTLAVKIGWLEIQAEFWRGTKAVIQAWNEMMDALTGRWDKFIRGIKVAGAKKDVEGALLDELGGGAKAPPLQDVFNKGLRDRDITANIDRKIAELERLRKEAIKKAAEGAANAGQKAAEAKGNSAAAMRGVADAAKGTFSPYALSQALAFSDRLGERIAQAAEKQVDQQAQANAFLEEIADKTGGGGPFRDDGG